MATLHNPTEFRVWCVPLQRRLEPGETIRISEDEAREVDGSVLVVERGSATPKRETAKRGGKQAEVTKGPESEKRG